MKYLLNENNAWVSKDQLGIPVEEEHDMKDKELVGSDNEFEVMFEIRPMTSLPKKASTSLWSSRMEIYLT